MGGLWSLMPGFFAHIPGQGGEPGHLGSSPLSGGIGSPTPGSFLHFMGGQWGFVGVPVAWILTSHNIFLPPQGGCMLVPAQALQGWGLQIAQVLSRYWAFEHLGREGVRAQMPQFSGRGVGLEGASRVGQRGRFGRGSQGSPGPISVALCESLG